MRLAVPMGWPLLAILSVLIPTVPGGAADQAPPPDGTPPPKTAPAPPPPSVIPLAQIAAQAAEAGNVLRTVKRSPAAARVRATVHDCATRYEPRGGS
jgi:hypothetical protein